MLNNDNNADDQQVNDGDKDYMQAACIDNDVLYSECDYKLNDSIFAYLHEKNESDFAEKISDVEHYLTFITGAFERDDERFIRVSLDAWERFLLDLSIRQSGKSVNYELKEDIIEYLSEIYDFCDDEEKIIKEVSDDCYIIKLICCEFDLKNCALNRDIILSARDEFVKNVDDDLKSTY